MYTTRLVVSYGLNPGLCIEGRILPCLLLVLMASYPGFSWRRITALASEYFCDKVSLLPGTRLVSICTTKYWKQEKDRPFPKTLWTEEVQMIFKSTQLLCFVTFTLWYRNGYACAAPCTHLSGHLPAVRVWMYLLSLQMQPATGARLLRVFTGPPNLPKATSHHGRLPGWSSSSTA